MCFCRRYKGLQDNFFSFTVKIALSVIIVMHRHKDPDGYLERLLDNECKMRVKRAHEKEEIKAGVVYVAPPNYHLLIEDDGMFSMSVAGAVNYARPSVDVVFESAAEVYGKELIRVVLTGANKDGSRGVRKNKGSGRPCNCPDT
jgi:two-component system chemotaxis response regulator CheB